MAKDPAVLFYTSDFISGTQFMTDEQVGIYMRLLCQQHQLGHIPTAHMEKVVGTGNRVVWDKFQQDESGSWFNARMDTEKEKRANFCHSRSKNRTSKKHMSPHMSPHVSLHMLPHMENENENDNININKDEIANTNHSAPTKETKPADPWRTDHAEYVRLFREAADELRSDAAYCTEIERIYTGIDVSKSLDASLLYWTLESTWKGRCRKKVKTIRPKEALRANISKSKVYYPRGSQPPPSIPYASSAGKPYRPQEY